MHLPGIGASDSHKAACVGFGYTILQEYITNETELINYIKAGKSTMIGGRHYDHTTKDKLGRINDVLVYSFWFYNKACALFRRKARNLELMENQIAESIRSGRRFHRRYIPINHKDDQVTV